MIWPYLSSLRGALGVCKDISEVREPRSDSAMAIRTGRTYLKALLRAQVFRLCNVSMFGNSMEGPDPSTKVSLAEYSGHLAKGMGEFVCSSMGESMAVLTAENLSARVGDGLKLSRNNGTQSQRIIDAFRTLFPESSPKLSLAAGSYTWDDGYVSPKPFPKSTGLL